MQSCFHSSISPLMSISKFISDQPYLTMLETKCTTMKDLHKIHAQLIKTGLIKDKIAASRVLAFCATSPACDIHYANLVFSQIQNRNLFAWNTIIRGFSRSSNPKIAISIFIEMLVDSPIEPENLTYPSVFKAYTQLGLAQNGAQLHGRVIKLGLESDTFIRNTVLHMYASAGFFEEARKLFDEDKEIDVVAWNSMIMGYSKCGKIDDSWRLFEKMPCKNEVSWNSMISGYVRNGKWDKALTLFSKMQEEHIKPSEFTLVSLLNACSRLGALKQGEWIHDYIMKNKIELNIIVTTSIIDMYSKCGNIKKACNFFETSPIKGLSCWNSMILGLATNGLQDEAIALFTRLESSKLKPDEISFIGVLTACNHSGLVDKAKVYFELMVQEYKIKPSIKHYGCMVDILARAGHIEEAKELIRTMPMDPDVIIWSSLLSGCKYHGNIETAKLAAEKLIELDSKESSGYVLMSNVYAASGEFQEAVEERSLMKEKDLKKQPGGSLIEVNGVVHEFLASGNLENMECFELSHYLS